MLHPACSQTKVSTWSQTSDVSVKWQNSNILFHHQDSQKNTNYMALIALSQVDQR